ncbi:MAG: YetF domain-containing protein, partial [Sporomusa sp.]
VGNIGSAVITSPEFSIQSGVMSLAIATLWVLAINSLSLASLPFRKLIESEPLMVMYKGKILEDNLKKRFYNINDLLELLRNQGIFDPEQVEIALIEPNGQLSVLKKSEFQAPTMVDSNIPTGSPMTASRLAGQEIIIDGKLIEHSLLQSGLTAAQLQSRLTTQGISSIKDVTLAIITPEGELYVDKYNDAQQE